MLRYVSMFSDFSLKQTPDSELYKMMKYACVRKCTFPLQLASVKHSIRCSDLNWFDVVDENMILGAIPLPNVLPDIMEESLVSTAW